MNIKKLLKHKINQTDKFHDLRYSIVKNSFYIAFLIFFLRAITIQVFPPSSSILENLSVRQYTHKLKLSPYRGFIYDRTNEPLAISTRKDSYFVNPRVFSPTNREIKLISEILKLDVKKIKKIARKRNYFYWLKRKIKVEGDDKKNLLRVSGLHTISEPARYYPFDSLAANVLGYVGTDNNGLIGLEKYYNRFLKGQTSNIEISRDARNKLIYKEFVSSLQDKSGSNIHLTIDKVIQDISDQALMKGIQSAKAKSGFVVVSDPHTGKILAVSNYPSFNPNDSRTLTALGMRNYAFADLFEPGSVVKPFVLAKALDGNKTTLHEVYNTHNGYYREGRWKISDSHGSKSMTAEDIIVESSNIGTYKIAKRLGQQGLSDYYRKIGFSTISQNSEINGITKGRIQNWKNWKPIRFANISFGQGFLVSAIEIVQAYGAIANGGKLMKPILVTQIKDEKGTLLKNTEPTIISEIMSSNTSKLIRETLQKVVERGTAKKARLAKYTSGGKTGTTQKAKPNGRGYSEELRIASFAGFAPVSDPQLVIYVVVDEPSIKPYYGGVWAAPIFKEIASKSLDYLNVKPDKTISKVKASNFTNKTL